VSGLRLGGLAVVRWRVRRAREPERGLLVRLARGRYGERTCFTENRSLATWESAEDRLEYYRGHRSGREGRERVDRLKETP
jgi:hypothetical protein